MLNNREPPLKILIIEDESNTRFLFERQLQTWGYAVTACPDAETALAAYRQTFYPLLMVDVGLPGMDGFELCRQIRALPQAEQSLIVIVTAFDSPQDILTAFDAGADDYLSKPISSEQLRVRLTILERQLHNLTERKRTENTLRESEHRFHELFDHMSNGVAVYEARDDGEDFIIKAFNQAGERINNVKRDDVVGRSALKMFPGVKEFGLFDVFQRVWRTGRSEHHPLSLYKDNRLTLWVENYVYKLLSGEIVAIYDDITERKRTEEALRSSEQQYHLLAESVADGIGIVQDGKLVFVNDAMAAMLGYTSAQLVGKSHSDLFQQDDNTQLKKMSTQIEQGLAAPQSWPILQCIVTGDNREIWMEGYYRVITWEGKPAILIDMRDITKRKIREMVIEEEREQLRRENITFRATIKERYRFGDIVGKSRVMQTVYELILKAAASEQEVLICGESGTGKELVARTIHQLSPRQGKAFVPVNCGAVPEPLFEREFFGHRKGAFTGADRDKQGFFDAAHRGTLFLDEIGELTATMQVKLLRAIETGEYTAIGETKPSKVDVRMIAATHRNLAEQVEQGLLREDFFYRIHVIVLTVPPLRERREDIPLLIDHFLHQYSEGKTLSILPGKILESLYNYDWPGNIRQLRNVLYRYLTVGYLDLTGPRHLASADRDIGLEAEFVQEEAGLQEVVESFEKQVITRTLEQQHWHRGKTAARLRIDPKTLYRKMKQYRLIE